MFPLFSEKEKNEAKCGNTFQLYERDEIHDAKQEHKTQEKLDEEKQKILNVEGNFSYNFL